MRLLDLGRRDYQEVWELQKRLASARATDRIPDTLILVEHNPVITLGRKTSPENIKRQDIPVYRVERGGDATFHGPGQLVGYPIVKLATPDVRRFVTQLEEVLIRSASRFRISAGRREGHRGVWVGERKLASIGVAVINWTTMHGFALNVNTDLSYFRLIRPCGLDPGKITSMKELLRKDVSFQDVKREVVLRFAEVFGLPVEEEPTAGLSLLRS